MLICIFRPKLGEKCKYMDLVGYKYRESLELHLREGSLLRLMVFTTILLML